MPPKKPAPGSSIRISEDVKVKAKVYVATRKMSLQALVDAAVLDYIKKG